METKYDTKNNMFYITGYRYKFNMYIDSIRHKLWETKDRNKSRLFNNNNLPNISIN